MLKRRDNAPEVAAEGQEAVSNLRRAPEGPGALNDDASAVPRWLLALVGFFGVLVAAAAAWAIELASTFYDTPAASLPPYRAEVFRSLLAFLTVGVGGAGLTFMFRLFEERRAANAALERHQHEIRELSKQKRIEQEVRDIAGIREFSLEVLSAYNSVKAVRRLMRAAIDPEWRSANRLFLIPDGEYRHLFSRLVDAQLELERLKKRTDLEVLLLKHFGWKDELRANLKSCESYIAEVIRDYEFHRHSLRDDGLWELDVNSFTFAFIYSDEYSRAFYQEPMTIEDGKNARTKFFAKMSELEDKAIKILSSEF